MDWNEGRVLWVGDSALDEGVQELMTRKEELLVAQALKVQQEEQQHAFGAQRGWKILAELGDEGQIIQVEDDEMLRVWTHSAEWSFKEMVAISEEALPSPVASAQAVGAVDSNIPSRDVQRIQDHLDDLRFSPLVRASLPTG